MSRFSCFYWEKRGISRTLNSQYLEKQFGKYRCGNKKMRAKNRYGKYFEVYKFWTKSPSIRTALKPSLMRLDLQAVEKIPRYVRMSFCPEIVANFVFLASELIGRFSKVYPELFVSRLISKRPVAANHGQHFSDPTGLW